MLYGIQSGREQFCRLYVCDLFLVSLLSCFVFWRNLCLYICITWRGTGFAGGIYNRFGDVEKSLAREMFLFFFFIFILHFSEFGIFMGDV
ncbi:hypothetical protein QBC44DRAFT_33952 [Cladorrhinum sp. PSN332]|nr:hypothetical protein QBC44DRAFT_33952 [Cladorrhinum sp. PSN332]